ncbi:MAG: FtsX-like permease family protein [Bacteroidetes bacterium]|nr:FtsX-like permease family protein [Bacteroidota bacterium]
MLKNNLKIAFRALSKNKVYTFVTFFGLTVGVAAALLIFRMLSYELSYNKSFENHDRMVRVVSEQTLPQEGESYTVCVPIPAMDVIMDEVPQFEKITRVKEFWVTTSLPDPNGGPPLKKFNMETDQTAFFTEPAFFDIFQPEWIIGGPAEILSEPGVIILTESFASKFYDDPAQAMGQTLVLDNVVEVEVKGIIKDFHDQTDFPVPFLSSWETMKAHRNYFFYDENMGSCSSNNQLFGLLKSQDQLEEANTVLAGISEKLYRRENQNSFRKHVLQPMSALHFDERYGHSGTHRTSMSRLRILGIVGILILIMACFNFINLATAQASLRAKEVGVRKTLGSSKRQLISQFLTETALIVFGALIFGLVLASLCLPLLQRISHVPEGINLFSDPQVWLFLGGLSILVTLLAGLYPSLVLSRFKPIRALRNQVPGNLSGGVALRKSLVVLQFVVAQGLVIGAIITLLQLDYIRSRDLGFSDDLVYTFGIGIDSSTLEKQLPLKQAFLEIPTVEKVSFNSDQPLSGNTWSSNFRYDTRPEDEQFSINLKFADTDYRETFGLSLVAGQWYEKSDTVRQCVVNETLLRKLGVERAQDAVGKSLRLGASRKVEITGVVEDFHTHSLHQEHDPLMITTRKAYYWEAGAKIRPGNIQGTLSAMQKAFDEILPEQVFEGRFLDENIAEFYADEDRLATTCKAFGLLAILISCLGLFGLAAHSAQQRVKEIGVRKVLGASTTGIVGLLSRDFLKLVLIALLVAAPLAWFLMQRWLDNFAYRIDIQWWVFVVTGGLAVLVAFLTISYQSLRAAMANPVDSLRNE